MRKSTVFCSLCLFALLSLGIMAVATAEAAFGLPSVESVGKSAVRSGVEKGSSSAAGGSMGSRPFSKATTVTHPEKNFRYTLPADWGISGLPDNKASDDVKNIPKHNPVFQNMPGGKIGPCAFGITIEPMVASFPRGSAVAAGLKQDKERIAIKQVETTKRRDQGDPKKKCASIGWETTEAKRPEAGNRRGIYYRAYDQDNVMYIFGASSEDQNFEMCKKDLKAIIDSIQFCVK